MIFKFKTKIITPAGPSELAKWLFVVVWADGGPRHWCGWAQRPRANGRHNPQCQHLQSTYSPGVEVTPVLDQLCKRTQRGASCGRTWRRGRCWTSGESRTSRWRWMETSETASCTATSPGGWEPWGLKGRPSSVGCESRASRGSTCWRKRAICGIMGSITRSASFMTPWRGFWVTGRV